MTLPVRHRRGTSRSWAWGVFALATLAVPANAQSQWLAGWGAPASAAPRPAVVRVTAVDGDGTSHGSGTLVAVGPQAGLIVTNWHVVRDAVGPITVRFPDGFESVAEVLKTDSEWDLAALRIRRPAAVPIPIAHLVPQVGEYLTIAGYGAGTYREARGRVVQYVAPSSRHPYEMIELSAEARNGDSGGPMLNARGELAGVLFGAAQGTTAGSYCGRVRAFLQDVLPRLERSPSELAQRRPPETDDARRNRTSPGAFAPTSPADPDGGFPSPASPARVAQAGVPPQAGGAGARGVVPLVPVAPGSEPVARAERQTDAFPQVAYDTPAYVPPPPPRRPPSAPNGRSWSAADAARYLKVLGDTPWEQAKTFLAIVGIVSIVMQFMGRKDAS